MIDTSQLLLFIPAALALNITPGADMLFCLGQSIKWGPKAGVAASFGVSTGSIIHTLLAAFGLATLLAATPWAFEVLRWAGVGYLIWLGIQAIKSNGVAFDSTKTVTSHAQENGEVKRLIMYRAWREGTIVNLFNPKVAIFILAFIPQFVDPAHGSTLIQFLIFGAIFNITGTTVNSIVALLGGRLGKIFTCNPSLSAWFQRVTGTLFFGLAAKLAFDRR